MGTIKVIGTTHSERPNHRGQRNILNERSDLLFFSKYGQRVNSETLIISEGAFDEKIIQPGHNHYQQKLAGISPLLAQYGATPDLLLSDCRYLLGKEQISQYEKQMIAAERFGRKHIAEINFQRPHTMIEAIHIIMNDQCDVSIRAYPTNEIMGMVRNFFCTDQKVNEVIIDRANQYKDRYKNILVILGDTHALTIAKETTWGLEIMENYLNFKAMCEMVLSYIILHEVPKIISKK